jgi:uncharacterized membrane protein
MSDTDQLPDHIAQTVRAVEELHLKHKDQASRFELLAEHGARALGQPMFPGVLALLVVGWFLAGWVADPKSYGEISPAGWLETALTVFAVFATLLILAGQQRQERLASHREQLTLELALLNEQKAAKIIALLEEFRRDSPNIADRSDSEAEAMSSKVDSKQVSEAIAQIETV